MALTVITGGARSGKSAFAVALGERWGGDVCLIATAEGRDVEMQRKIAAHRAERPEGWDVIEEPLDLVRALGLAGAEAVKIVDCLTLWVANLMEQGLTDEQILDVAERAAAVSKTRGSVVCVTNEVGSGLVPPTEIGRRYRDLLGAVNKIWVRASDHAYLMVSGRAVALLEPDAVP